MIKSVFYAYYETRHFLFEGFDATRDGAIKACSEALTRHAAQYNLPPEWCDVEEIESQEFTLGVPYRDSQAMR